MTSSCSHFTRIGCRHRLFLLLLGFLFLDFDPDSSMENTSFVACDKLDRAMNWVGASISSAFFASLERFSCINLSTNDDDEEEEEAKDRPLMLTKLVALEGEPHDPAAPVTFSISPSATDKLPLV